MPDVADLRVKYSADTSDFDRGADRVNSGIKGFISQAGAFAAGDLLAGGLRAIGNAAVGAGGAMFGMAMQSADLNAQISGIAALAGGGAEEMALLKEEISRLGMDENLVVSSTEAADVMQNLIANGLTVTDVLNGAAEATVLLGNAAGADLATSATVMSDTMTIFGIEAENAMTAVDGIARVTNQSKFDVNDYALALAQGGAQAASAGVEFDDFNAMLVAAASNFSSGSDAGTGIRNMLTKLIPTTSDATSTMYDLGLMTTDYEAAAQRLSGILGYSVEPNQYAVIDAFTAMSKAQGVNTSDLKQLNKAWDAFSGDFEDSAFFDAQGQLEDAATIAGALNTAFEGMSEQDVSEALNTMFGPDAARAVLAMAQYTEEGFRAMQTEMNGTASAMENAAIRTDNLKGDMDVFGGTLEAVSLKIGDSFQPALRTLYQAGTSLLGTFEPFLVGAADGIANYLNTVTPQITSWASSMATTMQTAFTNAQGGAGGIAAAIGSVTGGTVTFDADAEITNVNWGEFDYTYDATSDIHEVNWGNDTYIYDAAARIFKVDWEGSDGKGGAGTTFIYDATAQILNVDWVSKWTAGSFEYDATAGITKVEYHEEIFNVSYDAEAQVTKVDFGKGLFVGDYTSTSTVLSVAWGAWSNSYDATAQIAEKDVLWGAYTHTYNATIGIGEQSIAWGAWTYTYSADVTVASVGWGLYTHTYGADSNITSVLWGLYTNTYDADSKIGSVDFGLFSWTYDATGQVISVDWGIFNKVYDVTARISDWIIGEAPPVANTSGAMFGLPGNTGTGYNSPSYDSGGSFAPSDSRGGRAFGGLTPALAGTGGGGITININGYNADPESLARQIAAIIQRRG